MISKSLAFMNLDAFPPGFGYCPYVSYVSRLDLSRYAGKWFEIGRESNNLSDLGAQCTTAEYAPLADGRMRMVERAWQLLLGYNSIYATASQKGYGGSLATTLDGENLNQTPNYFVIDTDYDTFSVVYDCQQSGLTYKENLWIYSRTPTLSTSAVSKIQTKISSRLPHFDQSKIHWTAQNSKCKYEWTLASKPALELILLGFVQS